MKSSFENRHIFLSKGKSCASAWFRIIQWYRRMSQFRIKMGTIYNFSEIESSPSGSVEIQKLAREAGQAAASEARAVGIPKVFAKNGQVLKQYADGRIEVIAENCMEK